MQPPDRPSPPAVTVLHQLVDYLLHGGELRPGDRLPPERDLAEAFDVGRSAVREALKSLVVLGVIDVRHGSGSYLKDTEAPLLGEVLPWALLLGPQRLDEAVETHHLLERELVRLAARRHRPGDRHRLERHALALGHHDPLVRERAEHDFHDALAAMAGNGILAGLHRTSAGLLRDWHRSVLRQRHDHALTVAEHRAIAAGVTAGDPDQAMRAMDAHFSEERARVARLRAGP
jgi:GntR family transcriptional regulator, transcriptional repressor for pyruvate dehydrogenase complex